MLERYKDNTKDCVEQTNNSNGAAAEKPIEIRTWVVPKIITHY